MSDSPPSPPAKIRREGEVTPGYENQEIGTNGGIGDIIVRLELLCSSQENTHQSMQEDMEDVEKKIEDVQVTTEEPTAHSTSPAGRKRVRANNSNEVEASQDSKEDEAVMHDIFYEEEIALKQEKGIHRASALLERNDAILVKIKAKGRMSRSMRNVAEDIYLQRAAAYSSIEVKPVGFALREQCTLALSMNPNSFMALRLRSESYETAAMKKPINDPDHSKYLIRALTDMKNAARALELKVRVSEERQRRQEVDIMMDTDARKVSAIPERLSPVIEESVNLNDQEEQGSPPASDGETSSGASLVSVPTNSPNPQTPPTTPQEHERLSHEKKR